MTPKKKNKMLLNVKYGVFAHITKILLQFISRKLFLYYLGVDYLGVNSLFASVLSILSMTELGVGAAVAYSLYKPIAEQDERKISGIMCLYRNVYRVIGLVVLAAGLLMMPFIPGMIHTEKPVPYVEGLFLIVLVKTALTYLLFAYSQTILVASERKYEVDRIISIFYIITNLAELVALAVSRNYAVYLCVELLCLIVQQYVIFRAAKKRYPAVMAARGVSLEKEEKKEIWKNVYGLSINKFAGAILSAIDNVILSTYISTTIVGIYSNYTMILAAASGIISMAFTSVTANIGRKFADKTISEAHFYHLFYLNFLICGFCSILFYNLVNDFIGFVYGRDLLLPDSAVIAITLNMIVSYMSLVVQVFKDASGIFWQGKYRPVLTCVLNIVFSLALVKPFGITGVVLATALSRILTTFWFDPYLVFRYAFQKSAKSYIIKYMYYSVLIVLSIVIAQAIFRTPFFLNVTIASLLIKAVVTVCVSSVVLFVGTIWMKEAKSLINNVKGHSH